MDANNGVSPVAPTSIKRGMLSAVWGRSDSLETARPGTRQTRTNENLHLARVGVASSSPVFRSVIPGQDGVSTLRRDFHLLGWCRARLEESEGDYGQNCQRDGPDED